MHGRFLYVDDLVTDESERRLGHGALLLNRLKAEIAFWGKVIDDARIEKQ